MFGLKVNAYFSTSNSFFPTNFDSEKGEIFSIEVAFTFKREFENLHSSDDISPLPNHLFFSFFSPCHFLSFSLLFSSLLSFSKHESNRSKAKKRKKKRNETKRRKDGTTKSLIDKRGRNYWTFGYSQNTRNTRLHLI